MNQRQKEMHAKNHFVPADIFDLLQSKQIINHCILII